MYAVFTLRKLTATSRLNAAQTREMMMDNQQYALATEKTGYQMELSAQRQQNATTLSDMYTEYANAETDEDKATKKGLIDAFNEKVKASEEEINQKNYVIAAKESAVEMEKKSLETQITKWSKEIDNIEKAEANGIESANPKYTGLQA